jgi:hypothetical protein
LPASAYVCSGEVVRPQDAQEMCASIRAKLTTRSRDCWLVHMDASVLTPAAPDESERGTTPQPDVSWGLSAPSV